MLLIKQKMTSTINMIIKNRNREAHDALKHQDFIEILESILAVG